MYNNTSTLRKIKLRTTANGNIIGIRIEESKEVLRRLYERNQGPPENNADFQALTDVQARALYDLLVRNGVNLPTHERVSDED